MNDSPWKEGGSGAEKLTERMKDKREERRKRMERRKRGKDIINT